MVDRICSQFVLYESIAGNDENPENVPRLVTLVISGYKRITKLEERVYMMRKNS